MDLLCAEFVTTLDSSSLKDVLTVGGLHSDSKTVCFASFAVIWLERAFHNKQPSLNGSESESIPSDSGHVGLFELRLCLPEVLLHFLDYRGLQI